jgi:hypothetical protein
LYRYALEPEAELLLTAMRGGGRRGNDGGGGGGRGFGGAPVQVASS